MSSYLRERIKGIHNHGKIRYIDCEVVILKENYLVVKSNYFIMNSGYDLSLEEQKIILTLASMVNPEDEDFKPYQLKISEFIKLLGIKDQSKYTEVPKITKELMKKVFEIKEGDTLIQTAWLSSVKYTPGTGMVEMTFSHHLKPHLLQLGELYTQYRLKNILSMKSKYSIRVYEILKANEFKKQKYIDIKVDELRKLFKAEDIYPRFNDFKKNVLTKAQEELRVYSDIDFEMEELRVGKKAEAVRFIITSKKPQKENISDYIQEKPLRPDKTDTEGTGFVQVQAIIPESLSDAEAKSIYEAADGNLKLIQEVYQYYKEMSKKSKILNKVGYMLTLLKNGYKPQSTKNRKGNKDFEEREYDFEALERKLLGWD